MPVFVKTTTSPTSMDLPKTFKPNTPNSLKLTLSETDTKIKIKAEKVKISLEGLKTFNAKDILNAVPTSLRLTGTAKIPKLILSLGIQISTLLLPQALSLSQKLSDVCPTNIKLKEIIDVRNGIVRSLNSISKTLGVLTKMIDGVNTTISTLTDIIIGVQTAKTVASQAAKSIPIIPGAIPATLSDLGDLINKITFSTTGKAIIENYKSIIASSSLSISMVNGYILQIIIILDKIDTKIKLCDKYATNSLSTISPDLIKIANLQKQAEQTQNNVTYNGFTLEIETLPFTPTVNRKRAIGKNKDNIVLIKTELSFTTDDQILINELKLMIDSNNLKAY
jgi:hypothetical protein